MHMDHKRITTRATIYFIHKAVTQVNAEFYHKNKNLPSSHQVLVIVRLAPKQKQPDASFQTFPK